MRRLRQRIDNDELASGQKPFLCSLDEKWLLYHPLSDRLLVLNATAKAVWDSLSAGYDVDDIACTFSREFGLSLEQAARDVAQVIAHLSDDSTQPDLGGDQAGALESNRCSTGVVDHRSQLADCGTFRFGQTLIRVLSAVGELDESFFLRFRHRAVSNDHATETLEISENDSAYRLSFGGRVIAEQMTIGQTMSRLLELLLSLEHPPKSSLGLFHAGAVVDREGRSLLMPGNSGVGKSTLTAFLTAHGFAYLGDDIIAISDDEMALLPLPTCLSIKAGSRAVLEPFYPSLPTLETLNRYGRTIRYVGPQGNYESLPAGPAPSAIVFPAYSAGEPTRVTPLRPLETMIRLLDAHARLVDPATEDKLSKFLRFVEQTPAYDLSYSELPDAMKTIEDLLAS